MTITDRGSRIVPCPSCGRLDCKDSRKVTLLEVDTSKVTIDDTSQRRVTRQVDEFLSSEMSQEDMVEFMATHLTETPQEPAVVEVTGCTCGMCDKQPVAGKGSAVGQCISCGMYTNDDELFPGPHVGTWICRWCDATKQNPLSITVVVEQAGQQYVAQFDDVPIKTSAPATDRASAVEPCGAVRSDQWPEVNYPCTRPKDHVGRHEHRSKHPSGGYNWCFWEPVEHHATVAGSVDKVEPRNESGDECIRGGRFVSYSHLLAVEEQLSQAERERDEWRARAETVENLLNRR
jgi:hypothetical protein